MEKVLNNMPVQEKVNASKILEINPSHSVYEALKNAYNSGEEDKLRIYTSLLYDQALMIEGLPVENPVEMAKNISSLMV